MDQASDVPSIIFFIISYRLKTLYFLFCKFIKKKKKKIERNFEKKKILGTSDAWSMSRSSHRPREPAYYIEDCRILRDSKVFSYLLK